MRVLMSVRLLLVIFRHPLLWISFNRTVTEQLFSSLTRQAVRSVTDNKCHTVCICGELMRQHTHTHRSCLLPRYGTRSFDILWKNIFNPDARQWVMGALIITGSVKLVYRISVNNSQFLNLKHITYFINGLIGALWSFFELVNYFIIIKIFNSLILRLKTIDTFLKNGKLLSAAPSLYKIIVTSHENFPYS